MALVSSSIWQRSSERWITDLTWGSLGSKLEIIQDRIWNSIFRWVEDVTCAKFWVNKGKYSQLAFIFKGNNQADPWGAREQGQMFGALHCWGQQISLRMCRLSHEVQVQIGVWPYDWETCSNINERNILMDCTVLVLRMAHRIWKETNQEPGTAGPGNMLGSCLVSFHFLWAILSTRTVDKRWL